MKFYWGKDHHIWTYCMHLGPYTDPDGNKFDLGVYEEQRDDPDPVFGPSFAIVYGSDDHSYKSGPWMLSGCPTCCTETPVTLSAFVDTSSGKIVWFGRV